MARASLESASFEQPPAAHLPKAFQVVVRVPQGPDLALGNLNFHKSAKLLPPQQLGAS